MLRKIALTVFLAVWAFGLGVFEEAAAELAQNEYDKALELFEKSCEEKNAAGCYAAGFINDNNFAKDSNATKSFAQFSKACEMGDMDGCKSLGDIYENGRGGQEIDDKKSMQLYQKACSGGVGAACWKLAGYYDEGRGVERNLAEAFKFYQTACGD